MKLRIMKSGDTLTQTPNVFPLLAKQLTNNSVHLFIASNKWEEVEIDICEDIPKNVLTYIVGQAEAVKINLNSNVSKYEMQLLCEIYPEQQGAITRTFLKGGDLNVLLC